MRIISNRMGGRLSGFIIVGRHGFGWQYRAVLARYKDILMVMEEQYIPRPDPEEARKAVEKVKRLVKTQCEPCRRHGLTEEIAEAEAALLRLMGVE